MTAIEAAFLPTIIAVAFVAYGLGYRHGGNTCIKILDEVIKFYRSSK